MQKIDTFLLRLFILAIVIYALCAVGLHPLFCGILATISLVAIALNEIDK